MPIYLFNLSVEPLDPSSAETNDGEFYAWRYGSFHMARLVPNYPPRGAGHDSWLVQGPRGPYGTVERLASGYFRPTNPQGRPMISQGSLVDALGVLLPA